MKIDPKDIKPGMILIARTKDYTGGKVAWVDNDCVCIGNQPYSFLAYTFEVVKPEVKAGQVWRTTEGREVFITGYPNRMAYRYADGAWDYVGEGGLTYDDLIELVYDPKGE